MTQANDVFQTLQIICNVTPSKVCSLTIQFYFHFLRFIKMPTEKICCFKLGLQLGEDNSEMFRQKELGRLR